MKKLKKAYHLLFYYVLAFSFFKKDWNKKMIEELEEGLFSSTIAVIVLIGLSYFSTLSIIEIICGHTLYNAKSSISYMYILIYVALLFTLFYFTLIYKNRWKIYITEFQAYSKKKIRVTNVFVASFFILFILIIVISYIIWNKRYDAGLILPY